MRGPASDGRGPVGGLNRRRHPVVLEQHVDAREARLQQLHELLVSELALVELVVDEVLCLLGVEMMSSPSSAEHPTELVQHRIRIAHVLDRLEGDDEVEGAVLERATSHVSTHEVGGG